MLKGSLDKNDCDQKRFVTQLHNSLQLRVPSASTIFILLLLLLLVLLLLLLPICPPFFLFFFFFLVEDTIMFSRDPLMRLDTFFFSP